MNWPPALRLLVNRPSARRPLVNRLSVSRLPVNRLLASRPLAPRSPASRPPAAQLLANRPPAARSAAACWLGCVPAARPPALRPRARRPPANRPRARRPKQLRPPLPLRLRPRPPRPSACRDCPHRSGPGSPAPPGPVHRITAIQFEERPVASSGWSYGHTGSSLGFGKVRFFCARLDHGRPGCGTRSALGFPCLCPYLRSHARQGSRSTAPQVRWSQSKARSCPLLAIGDWSLNPCPTFSSRPAAMHPARGSSAGPPETSRPPVQL